MNTSQDIEQALGALSGGRVLDVATGRGGSAQALMAHLKDHAEVVAVDIKDWRENAGDGTCEREELHFVEMDAHCLKFDDAQFDTVNITHSLHHMADPLQVLREMRRVLRPGGHFLVTEMYRDGQREPQLTHVHLHHLAAEIDRAQGDTHNLTYTREELLDLIEHVGLDEWSFYDCAELDADPKDEARIEQLDGVIDRLIERARALPEADALLMRGEELRRRLHDVGLWSATNLVAIGQAPIRHRAGGAA